MANMMSFNLDKRFYTYIYLDPRKLDKNQYGDYEFDYEPFNKKNEKK